MSARQEREKAVAEHKKFLADNTKDEQKRYGEAKEETDRASKDLTDILIKINEAKSVLEPIRKERVDLSNELYQAKNNLREIQEKTAILLKRLADKESDFERTRESFATSKKHEEVELEIKRNRLVELQHDLDKTSADVSSKELSAINERVAAETKTADSYLKIAELKVLSLKHDANMANLAQKQAEIERKAQEASNTLKEAKSLETSLNSKEITLVKREENCDLKEHTQKDKDLEQNLKEVRLIKRERDLESIIETHNLRGKV